jgi:starch-binding outer membrane protein, SusD/RagB family
MKTIKIALFSLMFTCGMTSCDFLEKEPYKIVPENYFKDVNEAQKFLTGIYANLAQGSFYGNNYLTIAGGDDLTYYGGGTKRITSGLICNNATTSNAPITAFWANLYNGIERANMFL